MSIESIRKRWGPGTTGTPEANMGPRSDAIAHAPADIQKLLAVAVAAEVLKDTMQHRRVNPSVTWIAEVEALTRALDDLEATE